MDPALPPAARHSADSRSPARGRKLGSAGHAARGDRTRPAGPAHAADRPADHRTADTRHPAAPVAPEPVSGVQALDILGAVAQPVEPVAPFGPSTPLTRPPREQSRLVVVVLAVLVLVLGLFAASRLLAGFHPAPLITPGGGAPLSPSLNVGSVGPSTSAAPSAGASPSPSAAVTVAGAAAIDPQGDGSENGDLAKNAVDGDTSTSWHSERYDSPDFGGIKQGLGLVLDLGGTSTVTAVTVNAPGTDGAVELRASDSSQYDGSRPVATGRLTGSGKLLLTPARPVPTRYLILWFTRAPENGGERRIVVNEVDVR
jgi:eukaryotic-like serine/threonine-protein kinase